MTGAAGVAGDTDRGGEQARLAAEGGSLLLADEASRTLVFRHSLGVKPVPRGTAIPWDDGIAGSVFRSGAPAISRDTPRDGRHYKGIDAALGYVTRDMLAVPMRRWDGTTVGVLEVLNKRNGEFGPQDIALLAVAADIAATAIERARLHEDARLAEVARLFGDIGHDIKNLLTPVIVGADIIGEALPALDPGPDAPADSAAVRSLARCRWAVGALETAARRTQERLKEISDCIRVADEGLLFTALCNLVNNAIPEVPGGRAATLLRPPHEPQAPRQRPRRADREERRRGARRERRGGERAGRRHHLPDPPPRRALQPRASASARLSSPML